MFARLVLLSVFTAVVLMAGCKPGPKAARADTNEPQTSQSAAAAEPHAITLSAIEPNNEHAIPAGPKASLDANSTEPNNSTAPLSEPNDRSSFNSRFEPILTIYVDAEGKVDYTKLRRMRLLFAPLLQELSDLNPKDYDCWPKHEKIAFWINTFNVCSLKVVADNYPIKASPYKMLFYPASSIMQIDKAWTDYKFGVMGVAYSLSEIEQRILLNQFDEVRVPFALSYASRWSPRLRNEPYYGSRLDQQLDRQLREFIASDKGFRIDKNTDTVYLSMVFRETRFPAGFVEKYGNDHRFNDERPEIRAMLAYISTYLDRADVDYLSGKKYTVVYIKPDWALNE